MAGVILNAREFFSRQIIGDTDWKTEASCRNSDQSVFFPERGEDIHVARAICAGCPVREECAEYAIVNCEKYGVWGGLSERQRRQAWALRHREVAMRRDIA